MDIRKIPVEQINPAPYNPRVDLQPGDPEYEKLKRSIKEFGYIDPIIWNERTGNMVGGHQRYKILMEEKPTEIVVSVVDLDDAQEKALNIALNKIGGEFDEAKLQELLTELDTSGYDVTLTGFDGEELDAIIADLSLQDELDTEVKDDNFDADRAVSEIEEAVTKPGDVWLLGTHRLMCGDSTNPDDVKKLMGGQRAHMLFTSPPYNLGDNMRLRNIEEGKTNAYRKYDDNNSNYLELLTGFTSLALQHCDYSFVNIQHLSGNKIELIDYLHAFKHNFVDVMVWDKQVAAPAMPENVLNSQFEYVFIFKNEKNPSRTIALKHFRGTVSNVYTGMSVRNNEFRELNAATFPLHFPEHYLKTFCPEGGRVADFFGGTGTTMIVAEQLGISSFLMELDEKLCDVIVKRWEEFTGQTAKRIQHAA